MTNEELYIARVLFINRMLKTDGDGFQQLFWQVMSAKHGSDFVAIRPQGTFGDGGNDGYLSAEGHYFQVYGPVAPAEKVTEAASKLVGDFEKLKAFWNKSIPIRSYSFVFNDKYHGTFTKIAEALAKIEKDNPGVRCRPFTAGQMEDAFLTLTATDMNGIIGFLPEPTKIINIDYGILRDVISYIMNSPISSFATRLGDLPELDDKIQLNELCTGWGDIIRAGARQTGHVDTYFSKNSGFMKQQLKTHLVGLYQHARDGWRDKPAIPTGTQLAEFVFLAFRNDLLPPNATQAVQAAVDVLIGYYFEACDVFDPHAAKDSPSASP